MPWDVVSESTRGLEIVTSRERRGVSLSWQVTALVALVTVPLLLSLGYVAVARNRTALTIDAQHLHAALAGRVRGDVETELERARTVLSTVAEVLATERLTDDDARFALATANLRSWGGATAATVYDLEGHKQGSIRLDRDAETGPDTLPRELLTGDALTLGAVTVRRDAVVVPLVVPARTEPQEPARFYLYAELDLERLRAMLAELGEAPPLRDRGAVWLVDSSRRVVLHAELARVGQTIDEGGLGAALRGTPSFKQQLAVTTDFDAPEGRMMAALSAIPVAGWATVVQEPAAHAYQTLGALQLAIGAAVALAVLISLLAGLWGARRVVRPLDVLVSATQRLSRRQWGAVTGALATRADEVGGLARAMDEMSKALETSERELVSETRAKTALSRYLPADVVELVVKDPARLALGGERRLVTVLFADVVGFTRLAEALAPEATVAVLNEYFALATEIVHRHRGIVDKYLGDCVMAVWGVPERREDDARQALEAAEALRRWVEAANRRWRAKYGVEVQLAMGLNTGLVVAGNVGSARRLEYTVVGDAVNVAARLEASAAPGQILVSAETRAAVGEGSTLVELGERHLRGRTKAMTVFEVRSS